PPAVVIEVEQREAATVPGIVGSGNAGDVLELPVAEIHEDVVPLVAAERDAVIGRTTRADLLLLDAGGQLERRIGARDHAPPVASYVDRKSVLFRRRVVAIGHVEVEPAV